MKIRTAIALAALAVTPAFAAEQPATRTSTVTDEAMMTPVEKSAVESLQKEIATLQQAVDQLRKAAAERAELQAQPQTDRSASWGLWP